MARLLALVGPGLFQHGIVVEDIATARTALGPVLGCTAWAELPATDLAYDTATDRFLLTTDKGLYITDGALGRVLRHTVVDTGYSVDLARFTAGVFLASEIGRAHV